VASRAEGGPISAARLAPIRVVDLELSQPVPSLEGLGRYLGIEALVRQHGVPIGWVRLPVVDGRCTAAAIDRAISSWPTAPVEPVHLPTAPPHVTVSVCTRDRSADLSRCLDSLDRLDYPALDLLVVDNAPSNDAVERLIHSRYPRIRYVREPQPGLDRARNRAIAEARGEILAFTDDDVIVDPFWAAALASAFAEDPAVMAVTGLVVPYELESEAQVLFERYRSFARGFERARVQARGTTRSIAWRYGATAMFGTGANMAFRREVFDRLGGFDPALGAGTICRGGDDLDLLFRVIKAGHALVYEPRALVRHRHRSQLVELQRQIADHGVGFSAYLIRAALAYPEERLGLACLEAWWWSKLLYRALRPRMPPANAMRRLALAELRGSLAGLNRYQQARAAAANEAIIAAVSSV
jgi:O-antigen biosynthesis protein